MAASPAPAALASSSAGVLVQPSAAAAASSGTCTPSAVQVFVRCRPLPRGRSDSCVSVRDAVSVCICDPGHAADNIFRKARIRERAYAFDAAFGEACGNGLVTSVVTRSVVEGLLRGEAATVFAYGATGSGKTHSMLGSAADPGLTPRTLESLYAAIERARREEGAEVSVTASFVEIYCEQIRDLTREGGEVEATLDLREDPVRGICIAGVAEHEAADAAAVMRVLAEGSRRRTQEATAANAESSRSHAVLTLIVGIKSRAGGLAAGKLSLIDLAGSERAANTLNTGIRLIEGANINRSLLSLGNCINALARGRGAFVPFRDSKLTRLLKDSLLGSTKTMMLCCIAPQSTAYEETTNTLKYADRARRIKSVPRNVRAVRYQLSEYGSLVAGLRGEVATLQTRLALLGSTGGGGGGGELRPALPPLGREEPSRSEPVRALRAALVANFQDRVQILRSLAELAAKNEENSADAGRREAALQQQSGAATAAAAAGSAPSPPPRALAALTQLQAQIAANARMQAELSARLGANERAGAALRAEIEAVGGSDARELLTLEYRVLSLELDRVEGQAAALQLERRTAQREDELSRAQAALGGRDALIAAMRTALERAGALHTLDGKSLRALEALRSGGGDGRGSDRAPPDDCPLPRADTSARESLLDDDIDDDVDNGAELLEDDEEGEASWGGGSSASKNAEAHLDDAAAVVDHSLYRAGGRAGVPAAHAPPVGGGTAAPPPPPAPVPPLAESLRFLHGYDAWRRSGGAESGGAPDSRRIAGGTLDGGVISGHPVLESGVDRGRSGGIIVLRTRESSEADRAAASDAKAASARLRRMMASTAATSRLLLPAAGQGGPVPHQRQRQRGGGGGSIESRAESPSRAPRPLESLSLRRPRAAAAASPAPEDDSATAAAPALAEAATAAEAVERSGGWRQRGGGGSGGGGGSLGGGGGGGMRRVRIDAAAAHLSPQRRYASHSPPSASPYAQRQTMARPPQRGLAAIAPPSTLHSPPSLRQRGGAIDSSRLPAPASGRRGYSVGARLSSHRQVELETAELGDPLPPAAVIRSSLRALLRPRRNPSQSPQPAPAAAAAPPGPGADD